MNRFHRRTLTLRYKELTEAMRDVHFHKLERVSDVRLFNDLVDDILDVIDSQWLNLLCIQSIEVSDKRRIFLQYLATIGTFFEVLVYHTCSL